MKTFYKGIIMTGVHLLALQKLQDKNWMKKKTVSLEERKIAIQISYCDTI